jgi:carbon storage regulator
MLILTRRISEKIVIGDNITITLLDIYRGGSQIRIGVEAPRDVPVFRQELLPLRPKEELKPERETEPES